jgi:hypothetical protein
VARDKVRELKAACAEADDATPAAGHV